jgi:hypothetical protein
MKNRMVCNTIYFIQVVIRSIHFTIKGSLIQMALTSTHIVTVFVLPFLRDVVINRRLLYRCPSSILLLPIMMILVTMDVTVPGIVVCYVVHVIIFVKALASSSAGAD